MTIGEKIRNQRNKLNISQQEIAGYLGLTQRAYSKIENDEVQIKIDRLEEIAQILQTSAADLLTKEATQHFEKVQNSQFGNHNTMNNFNNSSEELMKLIQQKEQEVLELKELLKLKENE